MTDVAEMKARVNSLPYWFHTIDLGNGIVTPGAWGKETQIPLMRALDDIDFNGKKVLDIGCLDGLWSFEAERRGASEVYSIDKLGETAPGRQMYFETARDALGSKAHYIPDLSVYNVADIGVDDFDVILYLGVWYHLKDPLLAFSRLRQIMSDGGMLLGEGQVSDNETITAEFFYKRHFSDDPSNWWVPSIPCLREWVECSFFEIEADYKLSYMPWSCLPNTGRYILRGRAVRRADPYLGLPDDELVEFDLNRYGGDAGARDAMGEVVDLDAPEAEPAVSNWVPAPPEPRSAVAVESAAAVTANLGRAGSSSRLRVTNAPPEARTLVDDLNRAGLTYHQFDFGDGLVVKGIYDMAKFLAHYNLPDDMSGMEVLDVGTASGFFALECTARGAKVTALDIWDTPPLFSLAPLMGAEITYVKKDLYTLDESFGQFDLVVCGSVLMHLHDLFGAVNALRRVCRGRAIISTAVMAESPTEARPLCEFVAAKATDGGDYWAYWSVTASALSRICTTAGFTGVENLEHYTLEAEDGAGYEYGVPHVVLTALG
ncbi:MAG: class I SAM-dependent methyltransferase [Actinomycetota bacterium]|nr:class I SAM-dependent methyltransferase [Actinomycetota bacterium]